MRAPLSLALLLTLSCAGPTVEDAAAPLRYDALAAIPLELGTGREGFVPLPPFGATVPLVRGPQGGFHILGRYRFEGFAPDVYVSFRVTPTEGGAPFNNPVDRVRRLDQRGLQRAGDQWESSFAELVVFTAIRSPEQAIGRRVRWEVFVRSASTGEVATTEREVTIVASP